jgi:HlyD family secretion protein
MTKAWWIAVLMISTCTIPFTWGCSPPPAGAAAADAAQEQLLQVPTISPTRDSIARSTTQPATVHAYFEARLFTKVSGYLEKLNVDIGDSVSQGDVLAEVAVPELTKQRLARQAGILRLEAEERRAQAHLEVAKANTESYEARVAQASADVASAEAARRAAEVELTRMSDLVKREAVADRLLDEARKKFEAAEAEKSAALAAVHSADAELSLSRTQAIAAEVDLEVAKASTEVARRDLDELDELIKYSRLVSPFDGVVAERHVDLGDLVRDTQAGSSHDGPAMLVVKQVSRVRVRVAVPERDTPLVDVGDTAEIRMQAMPGHVFEGSVSRSSRTLDERTRTMLVEIDLPNPDGRLLPGMFGQATITLVPPGEKLLLPAGAVRHDEQGKAYVYVVSAAGEIQVIQVGTGLDDGRQVEITSGLKGDERVVGPILSRLKPGQKVIAEN